MKLNKSQIISWLKFLVGWPLSLVSIIFIIKLIIDKSSELNLDFSKINIFYLLFGIFLFFVYYLLRSFLWQQTLREKGHKIPFRENTYRFAFSEIKRYVPGNIWSFLSRGVLFAEIGVDKKTLGISLLADIQQVIIGCGVVSLLAIPWLLNSPDELKIRLVSLLPLSIIAIAIFFIATGLIYTKKYRNKNTDTPALHSTGVLANFFLPGFEFKSKVKLSILSVITYATFGAGNFFALLSIYNAGFADFLPLTSFFVFSLLIGYLSFITPMGLGVRETVITLGLSKITSLTNAGAIAIFTRIMLIISELLFLTLVFLWKKLSIK